MSLDKEVLLDLVRRESKDTDKKSKLLFLATYRWEEWKGLREDDAMAVLRLKLASGRTC